MGLRFVRISTTLDSGLRRNDDGADQGGVELLGPFKTIPEMARNLVGVGFARVPRGLHACASSDAHHSYVRANPDEAIDEALQNRNRAIPAPTKTHYEIPKERRGCAAFGGPRASATNVRTPEPLAAEWGRFCFECARSAKGSTASALRR